MRTSASRVLFAACLLATSASAQEPLADYFRQATAKIAGKGLEGIQSADDWKAQRPELQRRAREMLGLDPLPERAPLNATITRTLDQPDFRVEMLRYESSPGLIVTANLYLPESVQGRLPAILYVCGHSDQKKNGIIYGNKTHYAHHAAWYAANGYVCLVVDTLQLGEAPGLHHGTYREGMWWWYSRGYTPAGIEAWNGVRGIDYLISRPEVDPARIGVTGRSGGGATSWWLGAIDDRIAAVAPVAGITDLQNHVVDGCVQGHCDCMYFGNTYRWDYTTLAALCAPKAMLLENTNRDPIFPEDGVRRVFHALEKVYGWYGARDQLELLIGDGGHVDSIELRHPSFAFFERRLKGTTNPIITEPPRKPAMEDLKVLPPDAPPPASRNATIQETFVPPAVVPPLPTNAANWRTYRDATIAELLEKVFAGWPAAGERVNLAVSDRHDDSGRTVEFTSEPGVRLSILGKPSAPQSGEPIRLLVSDGSPSSIDADWTVFPRGVGPTAWPSAKDTHIRRRFYLLGQTLDGQRVWDVRRSLDALRQAGKLGDARVTLVGKGPTAPIALFASLFEPDVTSVELIDPPATFAEGPAFLNVEKVLDPPQAAALLFPRPLTLRGKVQPESWRWTAELGQRLNPGRTWPVVEPQP